MPVPRPAILFVLLEQDRLAEEYSALEGDSGKHP